MKKKIIWVICLVVLIGGIVFIITRLTPFKILEYTPKDGSKDISVDIVANIVLDRNLSDTEKNKFLVKITPDTEIDSSWAGKQINFAPKNGFKTKTTYSVEVIYNSRKLATYSFTTVDFTPEELKQQIIEQYPAERQFSEEWAKYVNANPWVIQLPIETNEYRIVYDEKTKSFRIRILVTVNDQQKQQIVDEALNDLKNIGVTQTPIPYYVLTQ